MSVAVFKNNNTAGGPVKVRLFFKMATLAEIIDADILATLNDFSGTLRWNGADYSVAAGDVQVDETLLIAGV